VPSFFRPFVGRTLHKFGGVLGAQVNMNQADKVKALVAAGVDRVKIQEQLGMSKASYYRCLKVT
jgi:hypothetical protein